MSQERQSLQYGEVIQFRCTPELEDMLKGDMANDGTLSLSQVAKLRLEISYGLTGGPDVAHDTPRSTPAQTAGEPTPQNVPPPSPPEAPAPAIREHPTGEITMKTLEIVAHLARQVLGANCMRVLELRDGQLWPLVDSGTKQEITDKLSAEGLALNDGVAGGSVTRNQLWFGPVQDSLKGTLEEDYQSVGCAPIVVTRPGGGHESPVYGLLFLGYKEAMVPTQVGRVNLVSFATALARIWGLDG